MDDHNDMHRKLPTTSPTNGAVAKQTSNEVAYSARLTMPEALEAVGNMLNAYPTARESVHGGWVGLMAKLLTQYPKSVALRCADPIDGVTRTARFLPNMAEAIAWIEREVQSLRSAAAWDQRGREQLADRDRFEREEKAESAEHRKAVADRIRAELIAHGFEFKQDKPTREQIEAWRNQFMAKHNITQGQYDALPDQPDKSDYWQGVRWPT